jgi:hypothetical protein
MVGSLVFSTRLARSRRSLEGDFASMSIRPGKKLAAVERLMQGGSAAQIAQSLGTTTERLELWQKTFVKAGKRALRYTMEPDEWPELDDIDASAQRAFPIRMMHQFDSAACFYVAQFFGKNDVIHIYRSGIPEVVLIDLDEQKLNHMRKIYPPNWEIYHGNAISIAKQFANTGRKFDLVVCDPYSGMVQDILRDNLQPFRSIATKCMMHFISSEEISRMADSAEFHKLAAAYCKLDPTAQLVELIKRSSHRGGVYWAVIRFDA